MVGKCFERRLRHEMFTRLEHAAREPTKQKSQRALLGFTVGKLNSDPWWDLPVKLPENDYRDF
jgi:hypothetical protein